MGVADRQLPPKMQPSQPPCKGRTRRILQMWSSSASASSGDRLWNHPQVVRQMRVSRCLRLPLAPGIASLRLGGPGRVGVVPVAATHCQNRLPWPLSGGAFRVSPFSLVREASNQARLMPYLLSRLDEMNVALTHSDRSADALINLD